LLASKVFFGGKKTKFETKVLKIRKLLIIANFNDGAKKLGYAQDLAATGNNSSSSCDLSNIK
jgi:hypothetical protein